MTVKISKKADTFKKSISPVRQIMNYADPEYMKKMGLKPESIISFAGGWVNHKAPKGLQEAYTEIATDEELFHKSGGYPPTLGTSDCRKAITSYEKHLFGIDLEPTQVAIGASSTQLTFSLIQALLNPGEPLLLIDPSYCNLPTQSVVASETKLLRFPLLDTENWEYNADEKIDEFYEYVIENKPKAVLLITPDNPTSQILSDKFVSTALEAVKEIDSFLMIDYAYKTIVFEEKYPRYFSWEPNDNYLSIHSNSKWSRNLGRRLGWLEAPENIINTLESLLGSCILCPDMLHEMALTRYINKAIEEKSLKPYIKQTNQKYQKAAETTTHAIKKHIGMPYLTPQGGLYTCIKTDMDGSKFVEKVLKQGVLFVPGWGFGRTTQNAVRVSYGPLVDKPEVIEEGMERVEKCLNA